MAAAQRYIYLSRLAQAISFNFILFSLVIQIYFCRGYEEIFDALLARGAEVLCKTDTGITTLILASSGGFANISRKCIAAGVDVNSRIESHGGTALMAAAHRGNTEIVSMLIRAGAHIDAVNKDGWCALLAAVDGGREAVVKLLLTSGANVNTTSTAGWTALMSAASNGYPKITDLLISYNAHLEARQEDGWTPLLMAATEGHKDVVTILILRGADVKVW